MKIIIVNDDGFEEIFHQQLISILKSQGHHVLSVTPDKNQSGVSSGITLNKSISFYQVNDGQYRVSGTPVDCSIVAVELAYRIWRGADLFISGINRGLNYGNCIVYSGTIAAARQACCMGFNALAISACGTVHQMSRSLLESIVCIVGKLNQYHSHDKFFLNVNVNDCGSGIVYEHEYIDVDFNFIDGAVLNFDEKLINIQLNNTPDVREFRVMLGLLSPKCGLSVIYDNVEFLDDIVSSLNSV